MPDPRAGSAVALTGAFFSSNLSKLSSLTDSLFVLYCVWWTDYLMVYSAYAAACLASSANVTVPATSVALTLPANWDGPVSLTLNTGQTVVAVIAGTILGGGALMLLSNL